MATANRRQAEMRPTPQSPSLGALASALRAVRSAGDVVNVPVLGGLGSLLVGRAPEEVEEWSYGNAPVRINPYAGRTASFVPEVKPGRAEQLADVVMLGADLAPLSRLAGRAASRGAMQAGRAGERLAERVVPGIMERGGAGAEALRSLAGGSRSQVIKPKGGNWLAGSVESEIAPLKRDATGRPLEQASLYGYRPELTPEAEAMNRWLDQKLARYVRNEMATPEDPLRLQAEAFAPRRAELLAAKDAQIAKATADLERARAERGVTPEMLTSSQARLRELRRERAFIEAQRGLHVDPDLVGINRYRAPELRVSQGYPREGMARNETARAWEDASDVAVQPERAGDLMLLRERSPTVRENPWLAKVPPETPVYSTNAVHGSSIVSEGLGFGHLTDELRNALNPESGLPESLRITPERLEKLNVAQAAKLVDDINAWRAVQTAEANRARAGNVATYVFKEYPESGERGLRWVELKVPTNKSMPEDEYTAGIEQLADALKYEGEVMGHCVGGYCPDVVEGRSRIFSLRDAEGRPYTTIEVRPGIIEPRLSGDVRLPDEIVQIKGPRNLAPPEDVLPYVQDFVRSQKWGEVRDLQNADLYDVADVENLGMFMPQARDILEVGTGPRTPLLRRAQEAGLFGDRRYMTRDEWEDVLRRQMQAEGALPPAAPSEGYAAGGLVNAYDAATIDRRAAELAAELQLQ